MDMIAKVRTLWSFSQENMQATGSSSDNKIRWLATNGLWSQNVLFGTLGYCEKNKFRSWHVGLYCCIETVSLSVHELVQPVQIVVWTPQLRRKERQGEKNTDRAQTWDLLYRRVSATRATDSGQDPPSPITLKYWSSHKYMFIFKALYVKIHSFYQTVHHTWAFSI